MAASASSKPATRVEAAATFRRALRTLHWALVVRHNPDAFASAPRRARRSFSKLARASGQLPIAVSDLCFRSNLSKSADARRLAASDRPQQDVWEPEKLPRRDEGAPRTSRSRGSSRLPLEKRPEVRRGQRSAEEIPLRLVATLIAEERELLRGRHPLRHDAQPEPVSHRDDGSGDRAMIGIPRELLNEGAIELDPIDRKTSEIVQEPKARSEIVEGDPHVPLLQVLEPRDASLGILHRGRLGDLEVE